MPGWMKHKLVSRLIREMSANSDVQMTPLYGRMWRVTTELPDECERGEWKNWLKTQDLKHKDHGIWSHDFMLNRWGNNGNSDRIYFLGLQNHCRWSCSHEIKKCLLLWRKVMINLDSILKSRDITLLTTVHLVKAMVFPVMYECESWTTKKQSTEELMLLNCGVGEESCKSLELHWDQTSQS